MNMGPDVQHENTGSPMRILKHALIAHIEQSDWEIVALKFAIKDWTLHEATSMQSQYGRRR